MNYHHIFHAGNFADVFKHITLILLIESLKRKDTPFCYLDTHAGIGRYDLLAEAAQKTKEYEEGIKQIWHNQSQSNVLPVIDLYLKIIADINEASQLRYYPGSPCIVRALLRPQDRMILTEFHPQEVEKLKQEFLQDHQVAVHFQDGYQALKAFLPPKERRGLVLIDPPYESADEFEQIIHGLQQALIRWATGIYAIWYPIKNRADTNKFINQLKQLTNNVLVEEFMIYPDDVPTRLNGCGMAIVNPPWQLDQAMVSLTAWLTTVLYSKS